MTEAQSLSKKTQLTVDKKRIIVRRKMETDQIKGKEIHRSVVGKSVRAGIHELDLDGPGAKRIAGAEMALDEGYSRGSHTEVKRITRYSVIA